LGLKNSMKNILTRVGLLLSVAIFGASCTTAYDSRGRAHKVVTPEGAIVGVAAASLIAYSIGRDKKKSSKKYYHHKPHYYKPAPNRRYYENHHSHSRRDYRYYNDRSNDQRTSRDRGRRSIN